MLEVVRVLKDVLVEVTCRLRVHTYSKDIHSGAGGREPILIFIFLKTYETEQFVRDVISHHIQNTQQSISVGKIKYVSEIYVSLIFLSFYHHLAHKKSSLSCFFWLCVHFLV